MRETTFAAKIDEKALPGTAFLGKNRFLLIFGIPGGTQKSLKIYESFGVKGSWEPSGSHFGRFSAFFSILAALLVHPGSSGAIFWRICIVFWPFFWCHLFIFACFFLSVSWYLWWVGWINVVGNLGVVSWWLGGMMVSPVFQPPSLSLSPLRVYTAATQQDSRKRTRQQHNGIVRQNHNKPTRKQRSKTAGQHDNKTATKPPTNPTTDWCGPAECAKRLNNSEFKILKY